MEGRLSELPWITWSDYTDTVIEYMGVIPVIMDLDSTSVIATALDMVRSGQAAGMVYDTPWLEVRDPSPWVWCFRVWCFRVRWFRVRWFRVGWFRVGWFRVYVVLYLIVVQP